MLRLFTCLVVTLLAIATAVAAELTISNPLPFSYEAVGKTHSELRDPCIIRDGDRWYVVFTMWPFRPRDEKHFADPDMGSSPGIRMYSTADFVSWRDEGWLVKSSDLSADSPYKHQFWAPEVRKFGNTFHLVFTASNWNAKDHKLQEGYYAFIGIADKVTGPYQHITKVPNGPCDSSLFADAKGDFYLAMPHKTISVQRVDLSRIREGVITREGKDTMALVCDADADGAIPEYLEGPWVEQINGKYHLFYAANYGRDGYWCGVATADSPLGPWTKDPRGKVFFGGHLAVFDGPDNHKWFSYRRERANDGRGLLCVDPFTVDSMGAVQAQDTFKQPRHLRVIPSSTP
jgi:xylan 1,4-beta-xylosidase